MTKQLSFLTLTTIVAVAYGFVYRLFVYDGGYVYLGITWLLAFVFLALFVIQTLVVSDRKTALIAIFVQSLAFTIFFYDKLFWWALSAFALCILLLWLAYLRGRHHAENMIHFRFFQLRHDVLSRAIIAFTLFSIILYMSAVNVQRLTITRDFLEYFSRPVEYAGQLFIEDFSLAMTTGDFLSRLADRNLADQLAELSLDQRAMAKQQVIGEFTRRFNDIARTRINLRSELIDVIIEAGNIQLRRIPETWRTPLLIGIGLALFLFVTGFIFLFSWIISFLSWLVFQLLLQVGFIKMTQERRDIEIITI